MTHRTWFESASRANGSPRRSSSHAFSRTLPVALAVALLAPVGAVASAQSPTDIERQTGHGAVRTAGSDPVIPDGVILADGLSDDEAVALALWNNAAFHADLAALGLARADLVEAGLLKNPILSFLFPLGPKQLEATVTLPLEIFWQRPRRVAAAKVDLERVATGLEQNALDLVRDTRLAFIDVLLAQARARLAHEAAELRREVASLVEARLRAGEIAELELIAARADLEAADEMAVRRDGDVVIARTRLGSLTNLEDLLTSIALTTPPAEPAVPANLDALVTAALAARPDLRASELAIEAAAKRAKWEASKVATLSGILDINGSGKKGFEAGPGIAAELPIFHQNKGGRSRAAAEVERAARQFLAVRERILLDVRQAYAEVAQARASLDALRQSVMPEASETVKVAELAFRDGDQSYLFVLEATRRLADARLAEAEALANLRRATARLERGLGRKHDFKP